MKLLKKLTAIIILLTMWITLNSPIISYAAETGGQTGDVGTDYEIKDVETWDISKNGDGSVKATWTLEDKKITISGNGEMKNWTSSSKGEWHNSQYTNIVEKIEIKAGVTNIGRSAFYNLVNVIRIVIPNTIAKIGWSAFYKCSSLKNIIIPSSVTSIEEDAFYGCRSLTNIEIPNSITNIEELGLNKECSSLENITINANNPYYVCINDVIYNKAETKLLIYSRGKKNTSFSIPSSVKIIGENAFANNSYIRNITIPSSVKRIEDGAFRNCSSLKVISIPNSVTSIGWYAFYGCSSLTNIEIPNSVTSIESYIFSGCSSLSSIIIPNTVTRIGLDAFKECENLTDIIIPNSVKDSSSLVELTKCKGPIRCYTNSKAHEYCENNEIPYILLDNKTTTISTNNKILEEEIWDISKNQDGSVMAKWTLENKTVTISGNGQMKNSGGNSYPRRADCIGKYTKLVEKIVIQNGVTNIGYNAFYKCSGLTNIEIPNSVTSIGDEAFSGCSSLKTITIPSSITNIGYFAFEGCSSLKTITIPSSVTSIEEDAFYGCSSLANINVDEYNKNYISIDGILYNKDKSELICYPAGKQDTSFSVPNSVTIIGQDAFKGCSSLTKITIPTSVRMIRGYAFSGCSSLTSIKIPQGVNKILGGTFNGCYSLTNITIPDSVTSIGVLAFSKCSSLKTITIPSNITNIDYFAFEGCEGLQSIKISNSVTEINSSAFNACYGTIICKKNSEAHRFAEKNKIGYIIDRSRPTITFSQNGNGTMARSRKTAVVVEDNYGVDEASLKYVWSPKEEITIKEITESFTNGAEIMTPRNIEGNIYLYIYAKDAVGSYIVAKSNAFNIDSLAPQLTVEFNPEGPTKQNVRVKVTSHEIMQDVEGWTLTNDKLKMTKTFSENATEEITVKDLAGNQIKANIEVNNIDRTPAQIEIGYSELDLTNKNVIVTITSNEKLQELEGWITFEDGLKLQKQYGENATEEFTVKDLAGNETKGNIKITNIDKVKPTVELGYSNTELTKENVTVTLTGNEKLQQIEGWTL